MSRSPMKRSSSLLGIGAIAGAYVLLLLGVQFVKDPAGALVDVVVIAVLCLALGATWPIYVSRRDRWVRTEAARAGGSVIVHAGAQAGDLRLAGLRPRDPISLTLSAGPKASSFGARGPSGGMTRIWWSACPGIRSPR